MDADELERTCKLMGVLYDETSRDQCFDRLVMQHVFALYGVHGPPASVLGALVGVKVAEDSGLSPGVGLPPTKLGLLAAYESDSDGDEKSKESAGTDVRQNGSRRNAAAAPDAAAGKHSVDVEERAKQWEQIEEEEEPPDDKPMSQWLVEKQVCTRGLASRVQGRESAPFVQQPPRLSAHVECQGCPAHVMRAAVEQCKDKCAGESSGRSRGEAAAGRAGT
jgi:hypothetical protein